MNLDLVAARRNALGDADIEAGGTADSGGRADAGRVAVTDFSRFAPSPDIIAAWTGGNLADVQGGLSLSSHGS